MLECPPSYIKPYAVFTESNVSESCICHALSPQCTLYAGCSLAPRARRRLATVLLGLQAAVLGYGDIIPDYTLPVYGGGDNLVFPRGGLIWVCMYIEQKISRPEACYCPCFSTQSVHNGLKWFLSPIMNPIRSPIMSLIMNSIINPIT